MRRTVVLAALTAAGAIGLLIALQAPNGTGVSQTRARQGTPAASEPPLAVREPGEHTSGRSSSGASTAPMPAADHMRADAATAVDSSSVQPRSQDAAPVRVTDVARSDSSSSNTDEAPVARPVTESSLSAQEVQDFFLADDACLVLGGDAKGRERCKRAEALAQVIVTVPKTSDDSWAYGMQYELDRRLQEVIDAGELRVPKRKEVQCNAAGCLVYVEGSGAWTSELVRLAVQIKSDPDIASLNDHGKWPGASRWNHGVDDRAMIVLPR